MKRRNNIFSIETDDAIDDLCEKPKKERVVPENGNTVFCPITDGFCKTVHCETCEYLERRFLQRIWLCSNCEVEGFKAQPFWGDTACDCCGAEFGVLRLFTKNKKPRKR